MTDPLVLVTVLSSIVAEAIVFVVVAVVRRDLWIPRVREWRKALREAPHLSLRQAAMIAVGIVAFSAAGLVTLESTTESVGSGPLLSAAAVGGLVLLGVTAFLLEFQLEIAEVSAKNEKLVMEKLDRIAALLDTRLPTPHEREEGEGEATQEEKADSKAH